MTFPDIWVLGDSIPFWAGMRAVQRGQPDLRLPEGTTIAWWGIRGMGWRQFIPSLQLDVALRSPPKIIIIHLGGNDITSHTIGGIARLIKQGIRYLRAAFPRKILVWVDILPRLNWGVAGDSLAAIHDKVRRVNIQGHKFISKGVGVQFHVLKVGIDGQTRGFFREDGVHLSAVGLEFYLDSLRDCLIHNLSK